MVVRLGEYANMWLYYVCVIDRNALLGSSIDLHVRGDLIIYFLIQYSLGFSQAILNWTWEDLIYIYVNTVDQSVCLY